MLKRVKYEGNCKQTLRRWCYNVIVTKFALCFFKVLD